MEQEIITFLEELEEGKSENNINAIQYNGWPVWWFFKQRFIRDRLLPPLPTHKEILNLIQNKQKPDNKLTSLRMRKSIVYNEKCKFFISRFNKIPKKTPDEKIMFIAHTNGVVPDKEYGFTVDRSGSVVNEIRKDPEMNEYVAVVKPMSHKPSLNLFNWNRGHLVYPFVDAEIRKKANKESKRLYAEWLSFLEQHPTSPIWEQLQPALRVFFSREILYLLVLYYELYKKIIRHGNIRLVCFYSIGFLGNCAMAAAHDSKIKSLFIYHALGTEVVKHDYPPSVYIAVPSKMHKDFETASSNVDPERIFITGPVFMDDIVPYIGRKTKNNPRKILLFSDPWDVSQLGSVIGDKSVYERYLSKFIKEINKISDVEIIIKIHPRDKVDFYKPFTNTSNVRIATGQSKEELYTLMSECDIAFGFNSSANGEAMVMHKPSVIINLVPEQTDPILNDSRALHLAPNDDVSELVGKLLDDEKFRADAVDNQNRIISDYLYKIDGKAKNRVKEIISNLLKSK